MRKLLQNPTHGHTSGLTFKILLLAPIRSGHLVPRCRKHLYVCLLFFTINIPHYILGPVNIQGAGSWGTVSNIFGQYLIDLQLNTRLQSKVLSLERLQF